MCPKFNEGSLEGFVNQLETRLKNMFHIETKFSTLFLENTKTETYEDATYHEIIKSSTLVIVILNEEHIKLPIKQSPYYICKAKLIGQEIPTQDVQVKHLQNIINM